MSTSVIGPHAVEVSAVDKELEKIWKSLAPAKGDDSQPAMQASVVNLVVVADTEAEADSSVELLARVMAKAPCRAIVLESEPDTDPPAIEANVSVVCERSGERQVCCEHIRISAKGILTDNLPRTTESFLAPDLPVLVWWQAPLNRFDLLDFTRLADRLVIDSLTYGATEMKQAADLIGQSRLHRTAVSDLNWARLTPYRQLFAQFFDAAECREYLRTIESVTIEATESAGILMAGWLLSRLDRWPQSITREQVTVKIVNGSAPVFRSLTMRSSGAEFAVIRSSQDMVEAHMLAGTESAKRMARIPIMPSERLLIDEIGRSGRDRAYDAAVRVGAGL
jgi:glucose-6-phosphate dehydrogenase assembly protein OpcA